MEPILSQAIHSVKNSRISFTKYITANDTGTTGAHQAGYYLHKSVWPLIFDKPCAKGENKDKFVTIRWQGEFETDSRFIYYGRGTRNEYRLTRFGRDFPFLHDDNIGDLLVISKLSGDYYEAFVLRRDEDIEGFFTYFNISSNDTNGIIQCAHESDPKTELAVCFKQYIGSLTADFPPTAELATRARDFYNSLNHISASDIVTQPDTMLLRWLDTEYDLFQAIENARYLPQINTLLKSVQELIDAANTILNRRKSRAGKSLEHHLEEIFQIFRLSFETQVVTEDNKKPDFLFPGIEAYANPKFDAAKIIVLASKRTCKDRWRQVLNEADRVKTKYLFTLQQGISKNQLDEMYKYDVRLVSPRAYIRSFPGEYQNKILSLDAFVKLVQATQQ